jgi:arginyl-tRNA synthetase
MTSFEGDTGPYLQYAHARLCSITRRAALSAEDIASADLSLLVEPQAINLIRVISQYPDVVQNTLKTLEPTTIMTYLFKMTHTVSSSYDHLQIVGSEKELQKARMALYDAARVVLNNGMRLLGLTPVERYVSPFILTSNNTNMIVECKSMDCLVGMELHGMVGLCL